MKMAKPLDKDINAAGAAASILNDISSGYYPSEARSLDIDFDADDTPTFFDPDDRDHLRLFYDLMNKTLEDAPGWPNRVIGGMCYVILFDENKIVNPDADCLELHPRFAEVQAQRDKLLAALKNASTALAWFESLYGDGIDGHAVLKQIADAIAKVEGGAA